MANNKCQIHADPDWEKYAAEAVELGLGQADQMDAAGNKVDNKKKKTPENVNPREKKKMTKDIKRLIRNDEEMSDFYMECATAWNLWA